MSTNQSATGSNGGRMISNESHYLKVNTLDSPAQQETLPSDIMEQVEATIADSKNGEFRSPFDSIPGFTKPSSEAIVDNSEVQKILQKEGFEVEEEKVSALNFFNSPIGAFQYALYYFEVVDFYIVLMVNKRKRSVYGYHVIDLTDQYSLSDDLSNRMKTQAVIF